MPDGLRKLKLDLAYEEAKEEARKRKARREKLPPPPPSPPKPAGDCNFDLLNIALEAAVPLWIHRFKDVPLERVLNRKRLEELGDIVAERGDVVLYCTKKKTADAFNKLAEALARLAHTQGGVLFNGVRYEAPARSA
jgi:hypothetical protein